MGVFINRLTQLPLVAFLVQDETRLSSDLQSSRAPVPPPLYDDILPTHLEDPEAVDNLRYSSGCRCVYEDLS